jgi:TRAF3-interacting protein 1
MGEEAPAWIQQTQQTLGTIVTKPKLTDNLLKKPPFRFLHDVVSATAKATGYPQGLYEGEMLDSKAIKDKETKIAYLQTLINCCGNSLGYAIDVNPKKIVAGHEPEKTNALLQALFEAATADPGAGQQAVQRTLAGETPGGAPAESKSQRPQSSSQKKRAEPQPDPPQAEEPAFPDAPPPAQAEAEKPRRRQKQRPEEAGQPPPPKPAPAPAPAPAAPAPAQAEANEFQPPGDRRPMERPQTARRAPPKVKTNEVDGRPTSGKPEQQEVRGDGPRVIGEGEDSDDDDDGMIMEAPPPLQGAPESGAAEHGGLVENLMAAQEAQAEAPQPLQGAPDGPEGPPSGGGIVIKRKIGTKKDGRANYGAEVATLREALQQLCQHANPLGKTMDYIQEDLDNMHKELEHWKSERRKRQLEQDELSKSSEDHLQPVVERQAKAKESVAEMLAKITAVKSQISSNDSQIKLLLQNVTTSSG